MVKLINFRCVECDQDEEIMFSTDEKEEELVGECPFCGGELIRFNFKNNSQRVFIQDPRK